jgi:fatty acid desaturase
MSVSYANIPLLYFAILSFTHIYSREKKGGVEISPRAVAVYNILNSLFSLYIFWNLAGYFVGDFSGINTPDNTHVRWLVYLHYLNKFVDFADTVIIVAKRNWRQCNFLHLFHHATIPVVWKICLDCYPTDNITYAFGAMMNSLIHFLMYIHYGLSAFKIPNPLRRSLTKCQMTQFVLCLVQPVYVMVAGYTKIWHLALLQMGYQLAMLALFYWHLFRDKGKSAPIEEVKPVAHEPKLIMIDGTSYDVSNFISEHPGGNVLEFYLDRDGSSAFHAFHPTNSRAHALLKTLPKVPTSTIEPEDNREFANMVAKWRDQGYFKPNPTRQLTWITLTVSSLGLGILLAHHHWIVLGATVTGLAWAHCGFVQHHAGHLGITGIRSIDLTIQEFFEAFLKGGSGRWWRSRHNKHHALPNVIGRDGDLRTVPFFAWDDVLVKKVPKCLRPVQHLIFLPILAFYVPVFFLTVNYYRLKRGHWDEIVLALCHYAILAQLLPSTSALALFLVLGYAIQGVYLGILFSLNHFTMPRVDQEDKLNWVKHQVKTSCNWGTDSPLATFASGYLNYQIEHHLVPTMPPEHYKQIAGDVQDYCQRHGIEYQNKSFSKALVDTFQGLYVAGH